MRQGTETDKRQQSKIQLSHSHTVTTQRL